MDTNASEIAAGIERTLSEAVLLTLEEEGSISANACRRALELLGQAASPARRDIPAPPRGRQEQ